MSDEEQPWPDSAIPLIGDPRIPRNLALPVSAEQNRIARLIYGTALVYTKETGQVATVAYLGRREWTALDGVPGMIVHQMEVRLMATCESMIGISPEGS